MLYSVTLLIKESKNAAGQVSEYLCSSVGKTPVKWLIFLLAFFFFQKLFISLLQICIMTQEMFDIQNATYFKVNLSENLWR